MKKKIITPNVLLTCNWKNLDSHPTTVIFLKYSLLSGTVVKTGSLSFSLGTFVCGDDSGGGSQLYINSNLCALTRRPGAYFRSTYQSLTCLILFLHLSLKCFTLSPSGGDLCLLWREGRGGGGRERESRGQLLWVVRNTSFCGELGEGRREACYYAASSRCACA